MWAISVLFASSNMMLRPAPRSFHSMRANAFTSGMKLASQIRLAKKVPFPLKASASPLKRSLKTKGLLKMKSRLWNRFMTRGAVVTA